jgi:hypothetical protein
VPQHRDTRTHRSERESGGREARERGAVVDIFQGKHVDERVEWWLIFFKARMPDGRRVKVEVRPDGVLSLSLSY